MHVRVHKVAHRVEGVHICGAHEAIVGQVRRRVLDVLIDNHVAVLRAAMCKLGFEKLNEDGFWEETRAPEEACKC